MKVEINMNKAFIVPLIIAFSILSFSLKGQQLKVIAYNVEFGRNTSPEDMSSLLMPEKADVICFNEVPGQGWTKKVGVLLGMLYSYEGKIASANHMKDYKDKSGKHYGKYKSILSKYPLKKSTEIPLKGIRWSPASAVISTINIKNNQEIHIFSLHIPTGIDEPEKSKAYDLANYLKNNYADSDKIILAGDFNDKYDSQAMQYLYNEGFKNPYRTLDMDLSKKTTLSKSDNNGSVIDHILYKGLILNSAGIIEDKTQSDHKAVWAIFNF